MFSPYIKHYFIEMPIIFADPKDSSIHIQRPQGYRFPASDRSSSHM